MNTNDMLFEDHIRATLRAVADTTPLDVDDDLISTGADHRHGVGPSRAFAWVAGIAAVIAAGSLLWVRHEVADRPSAAPTQQAGATLIPSELPAGTVLYTGTRQGPITSDSGAPWIPWAELVYAPADSDDPQQLVAVSAIDKPPCLTIDTVAIGSRTASICAAFYNSLSLNWTANGSTVLVVGGSGVAQPTLVDFAKQLPEALDDASTAPAIDGWRLVADNRSAISPASRQVQYDIGPPDATNGLSYFEVRVWTGVTPAAVYAIGDPHYGSQIRIGDQTATIDDKEPDNVFIFWSDPAGFVVSVQAYGHDRDAAIAFAASIHPADANTTTQFLHTASPPPFELPRDDN